MRHLSDLFADVFQVAYVTADLGAATTHLESTLGTAPFHVTRGASLGGSIRVDGVVAEEWVIDAALVYSGATNIEVIQPVRGAVELYTRHLRDGSLLTLHHLGFRVDDFDEASAVVERAGRHWAYAATFGDIRFGYLDTFDELGHHVEVMELGPLATTFFASIEAASKQEANA